MTYSRPGTSQVDAFGEVANPMAISRVGLRSKTEVSRNGAVVDERDPGQIVRNAEQKTKSIENFVSFLTKDVAPVVTGELKAQGNAAAMDAITSIPGMADGSFYRQSDEQQRKVLKDYSLNGYARDQLQNYGAGVAVGQYRSEIGDAFLASPILQSGAPQEERDREKQRILTEKRSLLRNVDPRYLAKYAQPLAEFEGQLIGKTEGLAREARNENLQNAATANFSSWWGDTAGNLLQYGDDLTPGDVAGYAIQLKNQLEANLTESLPTTTPKEWYELAEKGFFNSLSEAIGDEEPEKAQTLIAAWEIVSNEPIMSNGHNIWNFANKAGEDGKTVAEKLAAYKKIVDKLVDKRSQEIVLEANSADIGKAIDGDMQALDRVNNQIIALLDDEKFEEAQALSAALTQELSNADSRLVEDVEELGRLAALKRNPDVSNEQYAQELKGAIARRLIRSSTGAQEMRSRLSPSELEQREDQAIRYEEEKVVGTVKIDNENNAKYFSGENADVNKAYETAVKEEPGIETYMATQFFGDLEVAVRGKFKEGEPIPTGEELAKIIETESIKLIKQQTYQLRNTKAQTLQRQKERANSIKQPIYDAIEDGVDKDKIWGATIVKYANDNNLRPEDVWQSRYAEALVGMPVLGGAPRETYTRETAKKEAKEELKRIRRKMREQQRGSGYSPVQRSSDPASTPTSFSRPIPLSTEIAYETALPGFIETVQTASKEKDQDGPNGLLAVGGEKVLQALGRVLPGGGSPAVAGDLESELQRSDEAIKNSSGWKTLNRMFARRERVSATTQPLPQLPPTALTDTVPLAMTSDRHPFAVHIGVAEGTRTINGGYTRAYKGHRDPGDGHFNRGTFSGGRNMGNATPQQVDRHWMRELSARSARIAPVMARAGLKPGTVGYNRFMFNYLDLSVQAPRAADSFAAKISTVKAGGWSIEVIAKARADSFYSPVTGRLEASGFGNNYSRLLGDQRSRAGVWDYKRRT